LITLRRQGNEESLIKKIEFCKSDKKEKHRQLKEISK